MKVQQLIEKYKKLEGVWDAEGAELARQIFLQDLEQLDEPQPVKVPQFVADWYEENKDVFEGNLYRCAYNIPSVLCQRLETTFQTLVNMHQFGYEVEKEKKYEIKLLNRNDGDLYLVNQNANLADKYGHFSPVVLLFTKSTFFQKSAINSRKRK